MKTNGTQLAFSIVPDGDNGPALSTTTIGLAKLEAHLWEAANILRGPVDATVTRSVNHTSSLIRS